MSAVEETSEVVRVVLCVEVVAAVSGVITEGMVEIWDMADSTEVDSEGRHRKEVRAFSNAING